MIEVVIYVFLAYFVMLIAIDHNYDDGWSGGNEIVKDNAFVN